MPVETTAPRLQTILASISGVTRAYDRLPGSLAMADLPAFLIVPGAATQKMLSGRGSAGGAMQETRTYRLLLYVKPLSLETFNQAMNEVRPFFRRVQERFVAAHRLDNLDYVVHAHLVGDSGVTPLVYGRAEYAGVEFDLEVQEIYAATVDDV